MCVCVCVCVEAVGNGLYADLGAALNIVLTVLPVFGTPTRPMHQMLSYMSLTYVAMVLHQMLSYMSLMCVAMVSGGIWAPSPAV